MTFYEKIKDEVSEIKTQYKYQNDGTAFGHFAIRECFCNKIYDLGYEGTDIDGYIRDHIVDLANDLGNDAVFVNKNANHIFSFQFKYSNNSLLNTGEIKKNKRFFDWLLKISSDEYKPNRKLKKIIDEEIADVLTEQNVKEKNYSITFCYIDNEFDSKIKTDIDGLFTNYRDKNISFETKKYSYEELQELYDDVEIPKNKVKLGIIKDECFIKNLNFFFSDGESTDLETLVTTIKANSLKLAVEEHKELLFALNVRYYIGENEINHKIKEEYSKGKKSNFWILNNGINAVCEDFQISEDKQFIETKNFQIVNGGQTTKTLSKVVNDIPDEIGILMRLTKIKEKIKISKISKEIAMSSNRQNPITSRDLHSDDQFQRYISKQLDHVGIFYDKKVGEWNTVDKRKYKNQYDNNPRYWKISNKELGIAYLSFFLQIPISTEGRDKLIFRDDFYDKIFKPETSEDGQFRKLIFVYRLSEKINKIKIDKEKNFSILQNNYIEDVLLSLSALYFIKKPNISTSDEIKAEISKIFFDEYTDKENHFSLKLDDNFDTFMMSVINALEYKLEIMKEVKKQTGESWGDNDTPKWLKKDGTYKEIVAAVTKKLKQG